MATVSCVSKVLELHHFEVYRQVLRLLGRLDPTHLCPRDATVLTYNPDPALCEEKYNWLSGATSQFEGVGPAFEAVREFVSSNNAMIFISCFGEKSENAFAFLSHSSGFDLGEHTVRVVARHPYAAIQLLRQSLTTGVPVAIDSGGFSLDTSNHR